MGSIRCCSLEATEHKDRHENRFGESVQTRVADRQQLRATPTRVLWFLSLFCLQLRSSAQVIGQNICGCQPALYNFTLNFSQTCDDTDVKEGQRGINETACLEEIRGRNNVPANELVPVSVQTVQIFELDQLKQVVTQTVRPGPFANGDSFNYTSIISTINTNSKPQELPRGLQLIITGMNANGESTINTFIITFTNDCTVFPVLTEGQRAGWIFFSDLGDPPNMICPLSPAPTAPSSKPVSPASPAPVPTPTTSAPVVSTAPVPVAMPKPVCPPRRGNGYNRHRTEDDDYNGKGGKASNVKKDRHDKSERTMQMFSDRSLRAHNGGYGDCPDYDAVDHQEGQGKASRTDSASYKRVMKKRAEKSEKVMYHLDDDDRHDGKGMKY